MSDNMFNSDMDAILAEFASYSDHISGDDNKKSAAEPAPKATEAPASRPRSFREEWNGEPAEIPAEPAAEPDNAEYYVDVSMLTGYLRSRQSKEKKNEPAAAPRQETAKSPEKEPPRRKSSPSETREEFSPSFKPSGKDYSRPVPMKKKAPAKRKPLPEPNVDKVLSEAEQERASKIRERAEDKQARRQAQRSALRQNSEAEQEQREELFEQRQRSDRPLMKALAALFTIVSLLSFVWIAKNLHPDLGSSSATAVENRLDLPHNLDVYINNSYADSMGDTVYIKKIYTIPENPGSAPRPNPAAYGETTDPAVIEQVIKDAALLLDGQETLWNRDIAFYPGTTMQYYRDDSILVLTWKEVHDERCCTMAEVKVAHGSQFRRRLAEDSYGSSVQLYASEMAAASNAVVASNADFYAFRTMGVTVYQRQLFRAEPGRLDTCFVTSTGDMLFSRAGELTSPEQINAYIQENDVLFSLSFGPILVDNGELQYCEAYPIGEIDTQYSRAGIGMLDDLHYLLMTVNHTDGRPRANVNQFGQYMYEKGCIKAYNLDGGQTSEIVMNGEPVNYIDFNAERTVSDIIYFASAIPESEWASSAQTEVTQ